MDEINASDFLKKYIQSKTLQIIDVRAPVEYMEASLPQSVNFPILDNEQRKAIGTCYKKSGQEAAVELGHQLVSGEVKSGRVSAWISQLQKNESSYLTCARGGLRSKISQQWIYDAGSQVCRILGGYKEQRNLLLQGLSEATEIVSMHVLSGMTGSGKTQILEELMQQGQPGIDLESLANHRGSAFGKLGPQPSQASFENALALQMLRLPTKNKILVEDESRLIGRCVQPDLFFAKLRTQMLVLVRESIESRADWIYSTYIQKDAHGQLKSHEQLTQTLVDFRISLAAIQKKLGGLAFSEIDLLMKNSQAEVKSKGGAESAKLWILRLLKDYYDPLYQDSLDRRNPKIEFQGSRVEVTAFLRHNFSMGK